MIKDIVFVEDGSVDIDLLEENLSSETKVIVYRQGACKPEVLHLNNPIKYEDEVAQEKVQLNLPKAKLLMYGMSTMKMSKKLRRALKELWELLFK